MKTRKMKGLLPAMVLGAHDQCFLALGFIYKMTTGAHRSLYLGDRPSKPVNLLLEKVIKFTLVSRTKLKLLL